MKKTKTLADLASDLQKENEALQSLYKHFNSACKSEFGYDIKTIHRMLDKQAAFERRMEAKQNSNNVI